MAFLDQGRDGPTPYSWRAGKICRQPPEEEAIEYGVLDRLCLLLRDPQSSQLWVWWVW